MAEKQGPISVGDLAAAVVAQDPQLQNELKNLVTDIVGNMRYTMRHGDPAAKAALSKAVIPQLLSAISKVERDGARDEERAAYERMMAAIRGDLPADGIAS